MYVTFLFITFIIFYLFIYFLFFYILVTYYKIIFVYFTFVYIFYCFLFKRIYFIFQVKCLKDFTKVSLSFFLSLAPFPPSLSFYLWTSLSAEIALRLAPLPAIYVPVRSFSSANLQTLSTRKPSSQAFLHL